MLLQRVFTSLENVFLYGAESSWWRWRFEWSSSGVSSFIDYLNSLMIRATSGPHISHRINSDSWTLLTRSTTVFDGAIILLVNLIKSHLRKLVFWFLKSKEPFIKIFIKIWKHGFNCHQVKEIKTLNYWE